jgi:N-acetylmuramoyl-L-alanine amidase
MAQTMNNGRKTADATASGTPFCNVVTGYIAVENPKIISVEWVDKNDGKAVAAKYGAPLSLRVTTKDGPRCSIILCVRCAGWRQEYVKIVPVSRHGDVSCVAIDDTTDETIITFTPDAEWLLRFGPTSGEMTATAYLVWNRFGLDAGDEDRLRHIVNEYNVGNIKLRDFSRFDVPVFFDFKETEKLPISKIIIILDPGHGDDNANNRQYDPGTVSTNKTHLEKDYALILALSLKEQLLLDARYHVHLTREDNIKVDPEGPTNWRWKIANENNGDMLISFHLDGTSNSSVYAIRQEGMANATESERFAQFVLNKLSAILTIDSRVRNVKGYTRYDTLGVLNNFGGMAGFLFEFGGINSPITTIITNERQQIGVTLKAGIDEYVSAIW